MHFRSRVSTATIPELLFADDCVLNATKEGDMQRSMYIFAAACGKFRLRINTKKAVVRSHPPPNTTYNEAHINRWGLGPKLSNTAEIATSNSFTVLAHSLIEWDYTVTCASMLPSAPAIRTATATHTTTNDNSSAPDFSCPHCTRNFTSRIDLVVHLRIYRTEADRRVFEEDRLNHANVIYSYIRQSTEKEDPIPLLRTVEGAEILGDKKKTEHISWFFQYVMTTEPKFSPPNCEDEVMSTMEAVSFTEEIIQEELPNLKESTSPGPNATPVKLLKERASEMTKPLALLFQASFATGFLPSD
ncbi:unnamed protein product [Schistocephalus solidus]|uniref:C2H2-type domain-containing protein n=1 Tax=Schistocephalus solidus TaxID=70667 RepID=A0A183SPS7_SCHSO|nr:unnamed protein product [Schistocephalus solidus]